MKVLATLLLSLSLPGARMAPPLHPSVDRLASRQSANHGQWYLAESGHAVFCYGPVKLIKQPLPACGDILPWRQSHGAAEGLSGLRVSSTALIPYRHLRSPPRCWLRRNLGCLATFPK